MKLKYLGNGYYRGDDLTVKSGELTPEISDERAAQLLKTFPGWFREVGVVGKMQAAAKNKLARKGKDK